MVEDIICFLSTCGATVQSGLDSLNVEVLYHTQLGTHTRYDSSERILSHHRGRTYTIYKKHNRRTSMSQRESNPRSQQSSGRRPKIQTARPSESALLI